MAEVDSILRGGRSEAATKNESEKGKPMSAQDFDYPELDHPSLHQFAKTAEEFCGLIKNRRNTRKEVFFQKIHLVLARLYAEGLALPSTDLLWNPDDEQSDDYEEAEDRELAARPRKRDADSFYDWGDTFEGMQSYLGESNFYRLVFDPWRAMEEQPEVTAGLHDDLVDISGHMMAGLLKWRRGETGSALWEWRFFLENHWGYHALGALRALHARAAWHEGEWPSAEPTAHSLETGGGENSAVRRFLTLNSILAESHPHAIHEAEDLSHRIVDAERGDINQVWSVLWNKPLFSNARVEVAGKWCDVLGPFMIDAWDQWGKPDVFLITKIGPGIARSSFSVAGELADSVIQTGVPLHRLYAIQGAAIATRKRSDIGRAPYSDIAVLGLEETVPALRREFGFGWGPITVLHFLTDLGVAIKPDLHLKKTVFFLRYGRLPSGDSVPGYDESIAINKDVSRLLSELGWGNTPCKLRYLDKILMEVSRCGIIDVVLDRYGPVD
jgi:hypothetical protein